MNSDVNHVTLRGHLRADPVIRSTARGMKVANLSLATSQRYKDAAGATKEATEWHRIVVWAPDAELVEQRLKKGAHLSVEGELRSRSWTDRNGAKRYTTEVVARRLQLIDTPEQPPETRPDIISGTSRTDWPSCAQCGELMVRNGACHVCANCGATTGCS